MNIINKYIVICIVILVSIMPSLAVDNIATFPTCINPSYDVGYTFILTENHATNGNITSEAITGGYFTPSIVRANHGVEIVCSASDPTTAGSTGTINRVFATNSTDIWYSDNYLVNMYSGFYSASNPSSTIYKIGTATALDAYHLNRKLAFDSNGNVYTWDGDNIVRYVKSFDYAPQTFYTIVGGTDYTNVATHGILDIAIDSQDNVRLLIGTYCTGCGAAGTRHLDYSIINSAGTHVYEVLDLQTVSTGGGGSNTGFFYAGLVLDNQDSTSSHFYDNFTYMYTATSANPTPGVGTVYLKHNSTLGTTDIAGASLTGLTTGTDIEYYNHQIYVASRAENLVRSYVTTYTGYLQSGSSSAVELTYNSYSIESLYSNYYNNTPFEIQVDVSFSYTTLSTTHGSDYRYRVDLIDPSGVVRSTDYTTAPTCTGIFTFTCTLSRVFKYVPSGYWDNGSWHAVLYEYNAETYHLAYLSTSSNWTVYANSSNATVSVLEPPTSGSGASSINSIDGWTQMFGLGINSVSKFFFACFIILIFVFLGYKSTGEGMAGVIMGAIPYMWFVFISYIPSWSVVILAILVALKAGWFR